jgi:hypothetical protein
MRSTLEESTQIRTDLTRMADDHRSNERRTKRTVQRRRCRRGPGGWFENVPEVEQRGQQVYQSLVDWRRHASQAKSGETGI